MLSIVVVCLTGAAVAGAYVEEIFLNPTATWNNNGLKQCSGAEAKVSHGNYDKGGTRGTSFSSRGSACGFPEDKVAGNLKVKNQYMFRSGDWGVCWGSGWLLNQTFTWAITNYREWQNAQPCGKGVYRTEAHGAVHSVGSWHGENICLQTDRHEI